MLELILLQAGGEGGYSSFIMLAVMGVVFYFFFIRPQQKKQKDQKKFTEGVKKGDHAVTIGGIHGKVVEVNDGQVVLDIDRGTKLVVEKSSISMELSAKTGDKK